MTVQALIFLGAWLVTVLLILRDWKGTLRELRATIATLEKARDVVDQFGAALVSIADDEREAGVRARAALERALESLA